MQKIISYEAVTVGYINGEFINANLYISVEVDGTEICKQNVTIRNFSEAMKALRQVEKMAGHSAKLIDRDTYSGHMKWHYTGKTISNCYIKHT